MSEKLVRIQCAAIDEASAGIAIVRGVLVPEAVFHLKEDSYQREILPLASKAGLIAAYKAGERVPDIELAVRSENFEVEDDTTFLIRDDVWIVDGLQRVAAARHVIQTNEAGPRLGASIRFKSSYEWEHERFKILNADRVKLSSNILLRNAREHVPVFETLYNLSHEKGFVMEGRVCWNQRQARQELISASIYLKTISVLHAAFGPGRSHVQEDMARGLTAIMERVGRNTLRENVRVFFGLVDECWDIRNVVFKEGAVYLRGTFLWCLALLLAKHSTFWREAGSAADTRLFIEADLRRKLKSFPISDPEIIRLASASGQARNILYDRMKDWMNSGKRTRRLVERPLYDPTESGMEVIAATAKLTETAN